MKRLISLLLIAVLLLSGCQQQLPEDRLYRYFKERKTEFFLPADDAGAVFERMFAAHPEQQVYLGSVSTQTSLLGQTVTVDYENTHIKEETILCGSEQEVAVAALEQTLAGVESEGVMVLCDHQGDIAPEAYLRSLRQKNYLATMGHEDIQWSMITNDFTEDKVILLQATYIADADTVQQYRDDIRTEIERLADKLWSEQTEPIERVRAIHDWVIDRASYREGESEVLRDHTPYGLLFEGSAVCDGYTFATKLLLDAAGIENYLVEGTALDEPHIWNMVKLGTNYYHLDVTWDDPIDESGKAHKSYDYYLKGDAFMRKDHMWDASLVPECKQDH